MDVIGHWCHGMVVTAKKNKSLEFTVIDACNRYPFYQDDRHYTTLITPWEDIDTVLYLKSIYRLVIDTQDATMNHY